MPTYRPTLNQQNRTVQADGHIHGVVVGCQREDDRWLLIRRSETVAAPLGVCFPGGGVDGSETQPQTVVREMQEEVCATVIPLTCVWHSVSSAIPLTLWGWHATLVSSEVTPNPEEVAEILWLTPTEIVNHPDIMPHTDAFLESLLAQL
ncbi:MAG: NUDIX domain-containing protein [Pseudomonadales bacterium]|nr:NUDIX domain-containing protein [Pseudomonadales bacterium]MDP6317036.1 NUDIX domain-containing protein [Pseudomonadales bacterium]MDP7316211.1 NUDIX domain-containing protein [Pseudomonadales bacterium]MDP7577354.1 NUDIX domain-containing protein [Pseudomonadales bacterium]HJP49629.1 NUDIX domain-containing protein [Pseudomonadales bacterium]